MRRKRLERFAHGCSNKQAKEENDDGSGMNGLGVRLDRRQSSRCPSKVRVPTSVLRECFYIRFLTIKAEQGSQPTTDNSGIWDFYLSEWIFGTPCDGAPKENGEQCAGLVTAEEECN